MTGVVGPGLSTASYRGHTEESYTVGRAIFVFAGGTAKNFDEFQRNVSNEKGAKGPDFISRLKAHLNILPINDEENNQKKPEPKVGERLTQAIYRLAQAINKKSTGIGENSEEQTNDKNKEGKPIENCRTLLRRAIILRSILEREAKEILDGKKTRG